jgi:tetratricopeptide (TPR) repeat protein
MRALFSLLAALLLAVVVWLGARYADRIYYRMVLNKAIHTYVIHHEEEAIAQGLAILARRPDYQPALEAVIVWMASLGQFERAWNLANDHETTETLSPPARYQLAVCAYERGDEKQATRLFESLTTATVRSPEVPAPLVNAYLAMARGYNDSARTTLESARPRVEGTLLYHSLSGQVCYARGDVARAADELTRAVGLGERNPHTRLLLAVSLAMRGDQPGMERLLDELRREGRDAYGQARREIAVWLNRLSSSSYMSPEEQALHRDQMLNLRLADGALDVRENRFVHADELLAELARDFPGHLGITTRRGLLSERQGHKDRALEFYRREADRFFLAAYKTTLLDAAANLTSESAMLRKFLTTGSLPLEARAMNPSHGVAADRGWELFTTGDFTRTFSVGSTGRYALDLIARGDPADDIWPLVIVSLDGKAVAELYVNSPVWDLFEIHQTLFAGRHSIRLFFANDAAGPGIQGDRNFYLDRVIIRPESN